MRKEQKENHTKSLKKIYNYTKKKYDKVLFNLLVVKLFQHNIHIIFFLVQTLFS